MSLPPIPVHTRCGRIHLGPCVVNGRRANGTSGPKCFACGSELSEQDRDQINRTWHIVTDMLRPLRGEKTP